MTRMILVRHGHSLSNLNRCFTGQGDVPLSEIGKKQAELVAFALKNEKIDKIYAGDLMRTLQTATPTAKMLGLSIQTDPRFREIEAGDWTGRSFDDLIASYPESYRVWKEDVWNAHPDGGESVQELAAKVYGAVDEVIFANRGKTFVIFSHATPIRMLAYRYLGTEPASQIPWFGNASISEFDFDEGGTVFVKKAGDVSHLGDLCTNIPKGKA